MFSNSLVQDDQPILIAIEKHPFVKGIGNGHVPNNALITYVQQDYQYLSDFIKICASIIPHLNQLSTMEFFTRQMDFILNSEVHPHRIFCQVTYINYANLQHADTRPQTYLYQSHMYRAVQTGQVANILRDLLPYPWTYKEVANHMVVNGQNNPNNPFYEWINCYKPNPKNTSLTQELFAMLNQYAKHLSVTEKQTARDYFLKNCELEWQFWEQAYQQQDWRLS
jgi:thiaminase (transcriptional activator TenA)